MKITQGNDFTALWTIERFGKLVDLTTAQDIELKIKTVQGEKPIPALDWSLDTDSTIRIEFTSQFLEWLTKYRIELKFKTPDSTLADGFQESRATINAFEICDASECSNTPSEIELRTNITIGLKGDMGDSFMYKWVGTSLFVKTDNPNSDWIGVDLEGEKGDAFEFLDFTATQILDLKQPAIDAGLIAKGQGDIAEGQGNVAESKGDIAEQKGNVAEGQGNTAQQQGIDATTVINNKIAEVNSQIPIWGGQIDDKIDAIESEAVVWRSNEQERQAAELIRIANDDSRINSTAGTIEYNEINII